MNKHTLIVDERWRPDAAYLIERLQHMGGMQRESHWRHGQPDAELMENPHWTKC